MVQAYVTKERKKDSSPIMVAKSPPFYRERGRYHNRVKITIRVSPDKRKNPLLVLGSRLLSFAESGLDQVNAFPGSKAMTSGFVGT